jgi:hypothetical protein
MSRSRRKNPYRGWTVCDSEKDEKILANRRLRRASKQALLNGNEVFPLKKEISNVWNWGKDGKIYCGRKPDNTNSGWWHRAMRK